MKTTIRNNTDVVVLDRTPGTFMGTGIVVTLRTR